MFRIIVVPSNSSANAVMFYSRRETAEIAQKNIYDVQRGEVTATVLKIEDDFGHVLTIDHRNISYAILIDMEKARVLGIGDSASPMVKGGAA